MLDTGMPTAHSGIISGHSELDVLTGQLGVVNSAVSHQLLMFSKPLVHTQGACQTKMSSFLVLLVLLSNVDIVSCAL